LVEYACATLNGYLMQEFIPIYPARIRMDIRVPMVISLELQLFSLAYISWLSADLFVGIYIDGSSTGLLSADCTNVSSVHIIA